MDQPAYDALIDSLAAKLAHAIAIAEGYYVSGSIPNRINNPGDMKLGDRGNGIIEGKTVYATPEFGMAALVRECTAILIGASRIYSVTWTFIHVANEWTGGDNPGAWCHIVCDNIGVDPTITIKDWVTASAQTGEAQ